MINSRLLLTDRNSIYFEWYDSLTGKRKPQSDKNMRSDERKKEKSDENENERNAKIVSTTSFCLTKQTWCFQCDETYKCAKRMRAKWQGAACANARIETIYKYLSRNCIINLPRIVKYLTFFVRFFSWFKRHFHFGHFFFAASLFSRFIGSLSFALLQSNLQITFLSNDLLFYERRRK